MKDKVRVYRQGELAFIRLEKISDDMRNKLMGGKSIPRNVIREGEVTGHKHVASEDSVLKERNPNLSWDYNGGGGTRLPDGQMFLTSDNKIEIRHDEHKTLSLEKGDYIVRVQREYDEQQDRLIAD